MTYTTHDEISEKGNKKYRGLIKITSEMMAQGVLGLPKGIEIMDVYTDHREIIHFHLRSDELQEGIFETGEAMEIPQGVDIMRLLRKKAISGALNMAKHYPDLYEELLKEIEEEEKRDA